MQETQETGFDQGSGRSPGVGNSNPLQYSCLENSTDRGAGQPTAHGVAKSRTGLSNWAHTYTVIWDRTQKQQCNIAFEGEASKTLIGLKVAEEEPNVILSQVLGRALCDVHDEDSLLMLPEETH